MGSPGDSDDETDVHNARAHQHHRRQERSRPTTPKSDDPDLDHLDHPDQSDQSNRRNHPESQSTEDQELEYNHGLDNDTQASAISWPSSGESALDDSELADDTQPSQDTPSLRQPEPQAHSRLQRSKHFSRQIGTETVQPSSFKSARRKYTSLKDTKAVRVPHLPHHQLPPTLEYTNMHLHHRPQPCITH